MTQPPESTVRPDLRKNYLNSLASGTVQQLTGSLRTMNPRLKCSHKNCYWWHFYTTREIPMLRSEHREPVYIRATIRGINRVWEPNIAPADPTGIYSR